MVQFQISHEYPYHGPARYEARSGDYWKIASVETMSKKRIVESLEQNNYYVKRNDTKERYVELYHRQQRGLMSYDKSKPTELDTFLLQRRIALPKRRLPKAYKILLLEDADEDQTFERFFDLPPELRNRIYTMYFKDLGCLPFTSRQPPLCVASRQFRTETLKLFYSTCTFLIEFRSKWPQRYDLYISQDSKAFLRHTAPNYVSEMQNLRIRIDLVDIYLLTFDVSEWEINLAMRSIDRNGSRVLLQRKARGVLPTRLPPDYHLWVERCTSALSKVVEAVVDYPGLRRFGESDIQAMKSALEAVAWEK